MQSFINTQKGAEELIGPELANLILESVLAGFKDYSENVSDKSRTICSLATKASFINDHMIHHARRLMDGHPDVNFLPRNGRTHLFIKQQVEIKLKKLNSRRRSSNILTGAVWKYNNQLPLPFSPQLELLDFINPITHLIAGYQSNRLKTGVEAVYIVCPLSKVNKWEWRIDFVAPPQPVTKPETTPSAPPEARKVIAREINIQAI